MKTLQRPDLFAWTTFDEARDLDFHTLCWARPGGCVLIDPLPMSPHDHEHVVRLGGVSHVVVTNSDHLRAAPPLAELFGAKLCGPRAEAGALPEGARLLGSGDEVVPGLVVHELDGSKTPGELALCLEETTLLFGDLVRAHQAGRLNLLPDPKLTDKAAALASLAAVVDASPKVDAVWVGDGWPVFRAGAAALRALFDNAPPLDR